MWKNCTAPTPLQEFWYFVIIIFCSENNRSMLRLLVLTTFASVLRSKTSVAAMGTLTSLDFEVYGRVQGVFFRKYTQQEAQKLGLRGWCKNTSKGTVLGHVQGPTDNVQQMIQWLKTKGSPSSQIDKAEFRNQKEIADYAFDNFEIRKD